MTEQELYTLLLENISYQLRHANYGRTVEVATDCHMVTTGKGQEAQITRYRRFEQDKLKAQRVRLNNPITPIFISEPDKMFDKLTRVDGVRRDLATSNDKDKAALEETLWNFQPGVDVETWLVGQVRYLGKIDPNAWILFEREDRRGQSGEIEQTTLRPVIFRSTDVLNFATDSSGIPQWVLFRDIRFEYVIEGGMRRDKQLETYYLYSNNIVIRAREVGERTEIQSGEEEIQIDVYPVSPPPDAMMPPQTDYSAAKPFTAEKRKKSYYVSTIEHGASEVPAFCVGAYPDDITGQKSFVSWFYPGMPVLLDVIRDKQLHDVEMIIEAFRRRYEFSPVCEYETEDHARCDRGRIHSADGWTNCPACRGTGLRPNFTTEQEVIRLSMPENMEQVFELSKLSFEETIDTTLLTYLDAKMEVHRMRFLAAIFSSGIFQKPTGTEAQTATETVEKTNMAADILRPFGLVVSKGYELAFRVLASYREIGQIAVNHSYPEQIDLLTLEQEIANFAAIQQVDIYEAKVHQRRRILSKQFEGEPDTHKRIEARYRWLPFDDKSPEQTAQIIAALSPTDHNVILWTYWLQIFQEIEQKTPQFHALNYDAQKKIVDDKVNEFRQRIQLAGGGNEPDFETDDEPEAIETENN